MAQHTMPCDDWQQLQFRDKCEESRRSVTLPSLPRPPLSFGSAALAHFNQASTRTATANSNELTCARHFRGRAQTFRPAI